MSTKPAAFDVIYGECPSCAAAGAVSSVGLVIDDNFEGIMCDGVASHVFDENPVRETARKLPAESGTIVRSRRRLPSSSRSRRTGSRDRRDRRRARYKTGRRRCPKTGWFWFSPLHPPLAIHHPSRRSRGRARDSGGRLRPRAGGGRREPRRHPRRTTSQPFRSC